MTTSALIPLPYSSRWIKIVSVRIKYEICPDVPTLSISAVGTAFSIAFFPLLWFRSLIIPLLFNVIPRYIALVAFLIPPPSMNSFMLTFPTFASYLQITVHFALSHRIAFLYAHFEHASSHTCMSALSVVCFAKSLGVDFISAPRCCNWFLLDLLSLGRSWRSFIY